MRVNPRREGIVAHNLHEESKQNLGDVSTKSSCSVCTLALDAPSGPILCQPKEESWPRWL